MWGRRRSLGVSCVCVRDAMLHLMIAWADRVSCNGNTNRAKGRRMRRCEGVTALQRVCGASASVIVKSHPLIIVFCFVCSL